MTHLELFKTDHLKSEEKEMLHKKIKEIYGRSISTFSKAHAMLGCQDLDTTDRIEYVFADEHERLLYALLMSGGNFFISFPWEGKQEKRMFLRKKDSNEVALVFKYKKRENQDKLSVHVEWPRYGRLRNGWGFVSDYPESVEHLGSLMRVRPAFAAADEDRIVDMRLIKDYNSP